MRAVGLVVRSVVVSPRVYFIRSCLSLFLFVVFIKVRRFIDGN